MIQILKNLHSFSNKSINDLSKYHLKFTYSYTIATRSFHKKNENEHAHNILLNLPAYSQTTVNAKQLRLYQDQDRFNEVSVKKENKISLSSTLSKEFQYSDLHLKYKETCLQELNDEMYRISKFTDNELVHALLKLLTITPIKLECSKFVIETLNKECIKRSKHWTVNHILLIADIWYNIDACSKVSKKYYCLSVSKLFYKVDEMNTHQFIQTFFCLNLCRNYMFREQHFAIEKKIEEIIGSIGIEELGIISMGLFKSKNFINDSNLLKKIITILVSNKKYISNITLSSIFKILKKSFCGLHSDSINLYSIVVKEFQSEVENMNNSLLMHFASLGNNINMYDKNLLNNIFDQFSKNIHSARLKELERFSFILMNSGIKFKNSARIIQLIQTELLNPQRANEINYFFESFLSSVYYITCMGNYNSDLISRTLELNGKNFMQLKNGNTRYRHLFELNQMIEIEKPKGYEGYKLSNSTLSFISKKCVFPIPTWENPLITNREKQFLEVQDIIGNILKEEFTKITYVLPFSTTPDILFCTDKKGNLQKFPHTSFNYLPEDIKYKPEGELNWHALMSVNWTFNLRSPDNTNIVGGIMDRNIRLLKKLGYNIIIVDKRKIDKSAHKDSVHYVLKLLKTCVNKDWRRKLKGYANAS